MITLERLHLREIRMPLRTPFETSAGVQHHRRILLMEAIDRDGTVGWGECVAPEYPNYTEETIDTAWIALEQWLSPLVLRTSFASAAEVFDVLEKAVRGHRMAKAALEMTLWELEARKQGCSLATLLGGTRQEIAVGISLGIQPDAGRLRERIEEALERGYQRIKLKIKPGKDLEVVAQAHELIAGRVPLSVDANNAYTIEALPLFQKLDTYNLLMIEQPLEWQDLVRHAYLQKHLQTPVCLDESLTGPARVEDMLQLGSGRIVNIKPGRVGGFTPSLRMHAICQAHHIPVWCGGMLESGIGRAHNVALASLPGFSLPGDISESARYWQEDIVSPSWRMHRPGYLRVPVEHPGMGVEVDRERVQKLTVRERILEAK